MTLDELLLEWSYRSEKGYPSLDSPSDVLVLKEILNKLDLPSNTILNRLSEQDPSPLSVGELRKERDPHRADIFLQKELKCLAIARTPPRYCSRPKSLNTKTGSFPDLPSASQKTYSSIMVSPIIKTLVSLKLSIILLIA